MIEGRKPNYHISAKLADHSGDRAEYIRNRAFDDDHYKQMIIEYLVKFKTAKSSDINRLISDKLPAVLDEKQKNNKIKNLLQSLKINGLIEPKGKSWQISKTLTLDIPRHLQCSSCISNTGTIILNIL